MVTELQPSLRAARALLPGFRIVAILAATAAVLSWCLGRLGVSWISPVLLAILLGIAVRATIGVRPSWGPGTAFTTRRLLRWGIALLGFQFTVVQVISSGAEAVVAVLVIIVATAVIITLVRRVTHTSWRLSYLIGIGTAICGNSAIVAAAPLVKARDEEISYATFTITTFGMLAMLTYPLLGYSLGLDDAAYGMLAGAGIHDSAQSIASGFIYSEDAGAATAIVKLTRVAFLAPLLLFTTWVVTLLGERTGGAGTSAGKAIPWFALGFVGVAALRSVGDAVFGASAAWSNVANAVRMVALGLIVAAMVVVGLSTDMAKMRLIGFRPFILGLTSAIGVGGVALVFALAR